MFARICPALMALDVHELTSVISAMLNQGLTTELILRAEARMSELPVAHYQGYAIYSSTMNQFNSMPLQDKRMLFALSEWVTILSGAMKEIQKAQLQHELNTTMLPGLERLAGPVSKFAFIQEKRVLDLMKQQLSTAFSSFKSNADELEALQTMLDILLDSHIDLSKDMVALEPWSCRMLAAERARLPEAIKPVARVTPARRNFLGDMQVVTLVESTRVDLCQLKISK